MIRAFLDANVYASGMLGFDNDQSTPGAILRSWFGRSFELITSDLLIAEVARALDNAYFVARVSHRVYDLTMTALKQQARRVEITVLVSGVAAHPEDDLVLAAAVSAQADVLVTGNHKLQELKHYQGVTNVSPRAFLTLLEQEQDAAR
ncbi:MAG: putative toxin-antitoxin system toxin component, PIN family [Thermomicrobiales bacterium]